MRSVQIHFLVMGPLLRQNRRRGLLKGKQIYQLARDVAYGKRGKITARDFQEQRNTCSCLIFNSYNVNYENKLLLQILKSWPVSPEHTAKISFCYCWEKPRA